jgi:hypothetical protein
MTNRVSAIARQGKAYIPVYAKTEGGPYFIVEPVFTADLTVDSLMAAFEQAIAVGHPQIPRLTEEDMQRRKDPILAATGVKSWKKLAKDSACYTVSWHQGQITLYLHNLDKQGRFASSPDRTQPFPQNTPLRTIVEAILADARKLAESGVLDVEKP